MESFLTTVARLIREKELPALMIGGHAVTALGHPRATFDLDLLIPRPSASAWKTELAKLGYAPFAESANFIQLEVKSDFPLPPPSISCSSIPNFPLSLQSMEGKPQPKESGPKSLNEIDLPTGEGTRPHPPAFSIPASPKPTSPL